MLLLFLWLPLMSPAQSTVRVASYNVLNFPTGTMPDRQDTLAVILEDIQPDLLLLQELKSAEGLAMIVEESCRDWDWMEFCAAGQQQHLAVDSAGTTTYWYD